MNYEVHRWAQDRKGNPFLQITDTTGGDPFANDHSRINATGTIIAFISNRNETGHNPDLNHELMFWLEGAGLLQLTETIDGDVTDNSIDATGLHVAFVCNSRDFPDNPDGNNEIFLADLSALP